MSSRPHLRVIDCRTSADPTTVSVARVLLSKALNGELAGLVMAYKDREGNEQCLSTGNYSRRPDEASAAALRMAHRFARTEAAD